jgi:hypothetical protein
VIIVRTSAISRREASEFWQSDDPPKQRRAQGKPGAGWHPRPPVRQIVHRMHRGKTTGGPRQPGLPCAVVYGLLRALPGERAFLPPSPARSLLLTNLTPASRRQNHTTSPSATALRSSCASVASTASHRAFVTCATPLSSGETRGFKPVICPTPKAKYFCSDVWTGFADLPVVLFCRRRCREI